MSRELSFSEAELARIRAACQALNGVSYVEFIKTATMQAADEVLGVAAEVRRHPSSQGVGR